MRAPSRLIEPCSCGAAIFTRGTFFGALAGAGRLRRPASVPADGGAAPVRPRCRLVAGDWRRRRGRRMRQMRRDQELEAEQDRDRYRDRQDEALLVHQTLVLSPAGAVAGLGAVLGGGLGGGTGS